MKKLNFKGFAHWIVPALVLVAVTGIGTYLMVGSHAATTALTSGQCKLLGRVYSSPSCTDKCINGKSPVNATVYNYCPGAVSTTISSSTCDAKGRKMVPGNAGCARYWQQDGSGAASSGTKLGAIQCQGNTVSGGSATYHWVSTGTDYCTVSTSTPVSPPPYTPPPATKCGAPYVLSNGQCVVSQTSCSSISIYKTWSGICDREHYHPNILLIETRSGSFEDSTTRYISASNPSASDTDGDGHYIEHFGYPARIEVFSGSWKLCDDQSFSGDPCVGLKTGMNNICYLLASQGGTKPSPYDKELTQVGTNAPEQCRSWTDAYLKKA
jgi:hypothetical protein